MQPQRDPTEVMGRRIVAYLIDFALFAAIVVAVLALTKKSAYSSAPANACRVLRNRPDFAGQCLQIGSHVYTWKSGGLVTGYGIAAVVGLLNIAVLQGIAGASVGKLIVGLRVVDAQGQRCGIGRAFLRSILLVVDNFFCFLVGLLVAVLSHPHRRVGDMAAGTYVVAVADAGRPVVAAPTAYDYQYAQPGQPVWAPPGAAPPPASGWGAPPPAPGWGAPPAPTWGAPPPAPPAYGTPPSAPPPAWNAPPPPPVAEPPVERSGWGAPSPWTSPPPDEPAPTPPPPAPAPPPAADPAPPAQPAAPAEGESWWTKAISDDDEAEPES